MALQNILLFSSANSSILNFRSIFIKFYLAATTDFDVLRADPKGEVAFYAECVLHSRIDSIGKTYAATRWNSRP